MDRKFKPQSNFKDKVENIRESRKLKSTILLKKEIKVPGHILFEYNTVTKKLVRAEFKPSDLILDFTQSNPARHFLDKFNKIITKENCIYFQALNEINAIKRLKRDHQIIYKKNEN